ncbi:hypothetical protein D3C81_440180 [compost metagenome]
MFAHPAEPRLGRQRALQDGGRIDEGAPLPRGCLRGWQQCLAALLDALSQLFEPVAQHLVVVAPEGIAADVAQGRIAQGGGKARLEGEIVHPHRQHPQGARQQLVGPGSHHAVARHVVHGAVMTRIQPGLQSGFLEGEIRVGDADLVKS